jgi:hypothetical protein
MASTPVTATLVPINLAHHPFHQLVENEEPAIRGYAAWSVSPTIHHLFSTTVSVKMSFCRQVPVDVAVSSVSLMNIAGAGSHNQWLAFVVRTDLDHLGAKSPI